MASKADIGPKIGIEGEKQFRDEIRAINTGLKTLGSEMKLVTSEFIGNEKSVESLTAQNDVLDRTVSTLNERLAVQQQLLKSSADAFGEADARTQKLQQSVNSTQAAINEANAKIKKNSDLIKKNSGEAKSLSDVIKSSLTSSLEKLGKKLGISSSQVSALTNSFLGLSSGSLAAAGAVGVTVAAVTKLVAKLSELTDAAAAHADEIATLATNYNLTAKDIQRFQYMAELTDTSVETMTSSIAKLTKTMNSARDGSDSAVEAFARLGVKVTNDIDGSLRNANEVFMETIDALGRFENQTERDALTMDIFGKSAMELNSIIKLGSEGLAEYAAAADASGYVMSDKMVSALTEADDATQRLNKSRDALKNTLGAAFAPVFADVKNAVADAESWLALMIQDMLNLNDATNGLSGITDAFSTSTDDATNSLRAYNEELERAKLAEMSLAEQRNYLIKQMEDAGLGKEIKYSPSNSPWTFTTFVNTSDAARYNRGEVSFDALYNEKFSDHAARLQRENDLPPIDITLELDGKNLARATYDDFQAEANRRGPRAVY